MDILHTLDELTRLLLTLVYELAALVLPYALVIVWLARCLWGVNWRQMWPMLARGAWAPVVLLALMSAMVWAFLAPGSLSLGGGLTLPNGWWQLAGVVLVLGISGFCGWLQGRLGWTPAEVQFAPAVEHHDHGDHGHDQ